MPRSYKDHHRQPPVGRALSATFPANGGQCPPYGTLRQRPTRVPGWAAGGGDASSFTASFGDTGIGCRVALRAEKSSEQTRPTKTARPSTSQRPLRRIRRPQRGQKRAGSGIAFPQSLAGHRFIGGKYRSSGRPMTTGRRSGMSAGQWVPVRAYIRSICQYSSSSGVGRPKMVVMMRTLPWSPRISSTSPSKFSNGPLVTLTLSPLL